MLSVLQALLASLFPAQFAVLVAWFPSFPVGPSLAKNVPWFNCFAGLHWLRLRIVELIHFFLWAWTQHVESSEASQGHHSLSRCQTVVSTFASASPRNFMTYDFNSFQQSKPNIFVFGWTKNQVEHTKQDAAFCFVNFPNLCFVLGQFRDVFLGHTKLLCCTVLFWDCNFTVLYLWLVCSVTATFGSITILITIQSDESGVMMRWLTIILVMFIG